MTSQERKAFEAMREALRAYRSRYARIVKMLGWAESECDLWLGPDLQRIDDYAAGSLALADEIKS